MRTYTLVFSICAHVVAACAVLFTTVLATDELPTPRDGAVFVSVAPPPLPSPPPAARPRVEPTPVVNAIPLEAPIGVHAEVERPPLVPDFDPPVIGVVTGFDGDPRIALREEPPPPPPAPVGPMRVGGVVKAPARTQAVAPIYPAIARGAGVDGVVILEATIAEDGIVRDVRVLKSIPLLDQAAIDAVRQWRYTPTLLNGQPVAVLMTVTVAFALK